MTRDRRTQGDSARQLVDDPYRIARRARNRGAITHKALRYRDRVRLRYPDAVAEQLTMTDGWVVWSHRYGHRVLLSTGRDEREAWHTAERSIERREGPGVFDRLWRRAVGATPRHGEERPSW